MKIISISPLLGRGLKRSQARYWTVIGKYYEGDKGNKLAGKEAKMKIKSVPFSWSWNYIEKKNFLCSCCITFERAQLVQCHLISTHTYTITQIQKYKNIQIHKSAVNLYSGLSRPRICLKPCEIINFGASSLIYRGLEAMVKKNVTEGSTDSPKPPFQMFR